MKRLLAVAFAVGLIAGCATAPESERIVSGPRVDDVLASPETFIGTRATWGGRIVDVHNGRLATELEVLALPLSDTGRPRDGDVSPGRFKARIQGFVDPGVYRPERLVSVTGIIAQPQMDSVGDYPYRYPVLDAQSHQLWPVQKEAQVIYIYEPWFNSRRLNRGYYWRAFP